MASDMRPSIGVSFHPRSATNSFAHLLRALHSGIGEERLGFLCGLFS